MTGRVRWAVALLALLLVAWCIPPTSSAFTSSFQRATSAASGNGYPCEGYATAVKATAGLTHYWRLGETSGTTAAAAVGPINATYVNAPTLGVTRPNTTDVDKAVSFNEHGANHAAGRTVTPSSANASYPASNTTDGNAATYWESTTNATTSTPATITVDLGTSRTVGRVILRLPPAWSTRTQNLSIETSPDNVTYTAKISGAATFTYNADPAISNTVRANLTQHPARYVRVKITSNSGDVLYGQLGEVEVHTPLGQYVDTGSSTEFDFADTNSSGVPGREVFSIDGWFWVSSATTEPYGRLLSNEYTVSSPRSGWVIVYGRDGQDLLFERWGTGTVNGVTSTGVKQAVSAPVPTLNAWHHFAATYDGTTMNLYVDGVPATPSSSPVVELPSTGVATMRIGSSTESTSNTGWEQGITGAVDDIAVYDRELSAGRVGGHYTADCTHNNVVLGTPNVRAFWKLDSQRGSTSTRDSAGSGAADCDVVAPVTFGDPAVLPSGNGTSATFGGTGHLRCKTAADWAGLFDGVKAFSAEAWFTIGTAPGAGDYPRVISREQHSPTRGGWTLMVDPNRQLAFERWINGTTARKVVSTAPLAVGVPHLATATYDGASMRLYLNGVLQQTLATTEPIPAVTAPLMIGATGTAAAPLSTWQGGIDNVSVYPRALSQSEVTAHWAAR
ncbi:hypothetical protein NUM3379_41780 [Kineococcus sp. NUM-3379]